MFPAKQSPPAALPLLYSSALPAGVEEVRDQKAIVCPPLFLCQATESETTGMGDQPEEEEKVFNVMLKYC